MTSKRTLIGFLLLIFPVSAMAGEIARFNKTYRLNQNGIYQIRLNLDAAQFQLASSRKADEMRISVRYSEDEFKVSADFDEKRQRFEFYFDKRGWVNDDHDFIAEVDIELPTRTKLDLQAKVKAGEIDMDLGGLMLVVADLTTWAGEVHLDFSEPNKTTMEYLEINTKIGETRIRHLGNARFADLGINGGIGEMQVDFSGAMEANAKGDIDLDIGSTNLDFPSELGVKLKVAKFLFLSHIEVPYDFEHSGRHYVSKNYDMTTSKLDLRVSPGLGELQIN